jgi:aryl-alcohol dehydrogenase-like predicted oxidoreductase
MSIGQGQSEQLGQMTKDASFKLLDAYYDAGGNYIDTANGYQGEDSETWVGEWMQKRGEWQTGWPGADSRQSG